MLPRTLTQTHGTHDSRVLGMVSRPVAERLSPLAVHHHRHGPALFYWTTAPSHEYTTDQLARPQKDKMVTHPPFNRRIGPRAPRATVG